MGNFANTLFSTLLGWLRGAAAWLWAFVNDPEGGGLIVWIADNWLTLIILLCLAGMLIDFIVYMIRWQPYKVWASFFRRLLGRDEEEDTGRIRRRWIHADGTTSIEVVDAEEVPPEEVMPEPVFAAPMEAESLPESYVSRFARPQEQEAPEPDAPEAAERVPLTSRLLRYADEELPLNYVTPPAIDEAPAYNEPYYPPQWKRPADTGATGADAGGSL